MDRRCSVAGCARPYRACGYCATHWARWRQTGDPGPVENLPKGVKPRKGCSVLGCQRPHLSRGWCAIHYRRWYVTGTTDLSKESNFDRFWRQVEKTDTCWLWMGWKEKSGYGVFWLDGRNQMAHRVAMAWAGIEVSLGQQADHLCHIKNCVRPAHLEPVTPKLNTNRQFRHITRTQCVNGHPYEGNRSGSRCLICHREKEAARRAIKQFLSG